MCNPKQLAMKVLLVCLLLLSSLLLDTFILINYFALFAKILKISLQDVSLLNSHLHWYFSAQIFSRYLASKIKPVFNQFTLNDRLVHLLWKVPLSHFLANHFVSQVSPQSTLRKYNASFSPIHWVWSGYEAHNTHCKGVFYCSHFQQNNFAFP